MFMLEIDKVFCGDSALVLKDFPNECIDLVVTSPPYSDLRQYNGFTFNFEAIATQLWRVMKVGGVIVWVVGDKTINGSESGESFREALFFKSLGFNIHDTMVYEKKGFANPSNNRYHQTFEYMFVFSKGKPKTFNPIKDRKNKWIGGPWGKRTVRNAKGDLIIRDTIETKEEYGMRFNIWTYHPGALLCNFDKLKVGHPATFPDALAHDMIISWSNENDVILDVFAGSGTTLKEAVILKRNFVGIEISQEYCDLINERLKPYLEQKDINKFIE